MEAVARHAKVGKQTIYRWWPTRIELLIEVYDSYAPALQDLDAGRPLSTVLETLFKLYRNGPAGELLAAIIALSRSDSAAISLFEERFLVPRREALVSYLVRSGETPAAAAEDAADLVVAHIWYALLSNPHRLNRKYVERICALVNPTHTNSTPDTFTLHEGYVPGFAGEMIRLHMAYYADAWDFGANFETHLLRDFTAILENYNPASDQLIRVENQHGEIFATLVMQTHDQPENAARVRFFIMDKRITGQGFGQKMLAQALETCRQRGQTQLHLTTFKGLDAARTLYERAGFQLTEEYQDDDWNEGTGEVRYDLRLS